ncbi:LexA family protein [Bosea sp. 2KB_26]|uniref:LexA family protein n=1 Tax=Bosea sp. 2KB_26 TaxID=3237475 RepID=UPI003F931051
MRQGLTPRLAQLLAFIQSASRRNACAPSYAEMATALGIRSRGAVAAMIDRLEERGFVRRVSGTARSITIIEQAGLSPALEAEIEAYCRNIRISRQEFDKRAAQSLLRGRP